MATLQTRDPAKSLHADARQPREDESMSDPPSRGDIRDELDRARAEFSALVAESTPADLRRPSNGTRWTNRELLFHMVFGYLITRNLRFLFAVM
ncbi:MAG TPA: DinB family protein, partial [Acidimicrobiales bacterium]|nr:DinB family protein [Acidimicrobiales bacterium]